MFQEGWVSDVHTVIHTGVLQATLCFTYKNITMNYIIHRTYTVLFFFIVNMEWRKKKCLLGSERVDSRLPLIQGFLELAYLSGGGPNQTERGNKFIVMRSWIQNETGAEWILIHFTGSISFPSVHGQWLHTVTPQLTCWSVPSPPSACLWSPSGLRTEGEEEQPQSSPEKKTLTVKQRNVITDFLTSVDFGVRGNLINLNAAYDKL